jgi:hypothetical protein
MIVETHKLPISPIVLVVGILISCTLGHAEESYKLGQIKDFYALFPNGPPSTTSGHYEYNSGGVPLLGVVMRSPADPPPLDNTPVNFRTCSNATMEVEFKLLKAVARKCQPIKKPGDPVFAVVPFIKADSKPGNPMVNFQGQIVDLTKLPTSYTEAVAKAKPGDWVGYAFTDENGSKRAVFLANESPAMPKAAPAVPPQ